MHRLFRLRGHGPQAEEVLLDPLVKKQAGHDRGQKGDHDIAQQQQTLRVFAEQAIKETAAALEVESQHRQNGSDLHHHGVGIRAFGGGNAEDFLREQDVAGGTDREIFGQAFDDADEDRLPPIHKTFFVKSGMAPWQEQAAARARNCGTAESGQGRPQKETRGGILFAG